MGCSKMEYGMFFVMEIQAEKAVHKQIRLPVQRLVFLPVEEQNLSNERSV